MATQIIQLDRDPDDQNWGGWTEGTIRRVAQAMGLPANAQGMVRAQQSLQATPESGAGDIAVIDPSGKMITAYNAGASGAHGGDKGEFQGPDGNWYRPADSYIAEAIKAHPSSGIDDFFNNFAGFLPFALAGGLALGPLSGAGLAAEGAATAGLGDLAASYGVGGGGAGAAAGEFGSVLTGGAGSAFPTTAAEIAAANEAAAAAIGETVATGTTGITVPGATGGLQGVLEGLQSIPPGSTTALQQLTNGLDAEDAAIGQQMQAAANQGGGPGITTPINTVNGLGGVAGAAGNALSRILDGTATTADWTSVLGGAGSTLLGVLGSQAQTGALQDMQNQWLGLGAPSRARFEGSFAPGFDLAASDPGFRNALDTSAQTAARSWSARAGNPAGSPTAQAEINKYVLGSTYLPQLNTYRSQNLTGGQLGTNQAGTASLGVAQGSDNLYNSLGYGLGQLTQPQNNTGGALANLLQRYSLNLGGSLT